MNVSSTLHGKGDMNYFSTQGKVQNNAAASDGNVGKIGLLEGSKRYGSCKLLLLMASYALQRQLKTVS